MWPFKRKNKKGEIKRVQPVREPGKIATIRQKFSLVSLIIAITFTAATSAVIILGGQVMYWRLGQKPRQDIRVRRAFKELDVQATEKARLQAKESTPNYYRLNKSFLKQIDQDLTKFYTDIKAINNFKSLPEKKRKHIIAKWKINAKTFDKLRKDILKISPEQFRANIKKLKQALINSNFIEVMPAEYRTVNIVILSDPDLNIHKRTDKWQFIKNKQAVKQFIDNAVKVIDPPLRPIVRNYLVDNFKPIWLFDKAQTDKQRQIRYESDENLRYEKFQPGIVLVPRDQEIGKRDLHLLELEHQAYWKSIEPRKKLLAYSGIIITVFLITMALWVYCYKFQPKAIQNWARSLALAITLFAMVSLARIASLAGLNDYCSVFGVVFIGIVMTIAYEQRFALMTVATLTALLMIALHGNVSLFLTLLSAGTTAVITLDEIRTRSKLIEVATASAAISFAVVWSSQLADYQEVSFIIRNAISAAGGALLAGFVVQGILPMIEQIFQIATSMTLLEWSDPSKPLLRRLALEVPGTFNHSLLIGSLAESAAEAIGANGLLARVGAYYHDIGKINKPQYFVENQPSKDFSKHKDLTPAMSLLVIIGHVKDGLELAKEYNLPKILHQFIAEHHGTTVVEYFYHQAAKQAQESGQEISDIEFRYPGPKPHSKESAILMLADSVEGATRALSEPTAGRIEATVHQIIQKKIADGQLDECELTLRDLHIIEESMIKSLCSIYHSRIKYPSQEKTDNSQEEQQSQAPATKVAKGN